MLWWLIAIGVLIIGIAIAYSVLLANNNIGDQTKLERGFTKEEQQTIEEHSISLDELRKHNGKDAPPLIAIDGVVYDLSGTPSWAQGLHHGVQAGTDGTDSFVRSRHGKETLEKMTVVGSLDP